MLSIKIKQQDLLHDGKNISDSIAYFYESYIYDLLNIPKRISVNTYRLITSACKLSAFEYGNKESRESNNHTKRSNWSSFKETLHRNLDMSQQP